MKSQFLNCRDSKLQPSLFVFLFDTLTLNSLCKAMPWECHAKFRSRIQSVTAILDQWRWATVLNFQRSCSRIAKRHCELRFTNKNSQHHIWYSSTSTHSRCSTRSIWKKRDLELEQEPRSTCHAIPSEFSWCPCLWLESRHDMTHSECWNPQV